MRRVRTNRVKPYRLRRMERELRLWQEKLEDWEERLQWTTAKEREEALVKAQFLRKLAAETWIHLIACKSKTGFELGPSAIRARRTFRQLKIYWNALAPKIEKLIPAQIPDTDEFKAVSDEGQVA